MFLYVLTSYFNTLGGFSGWPKLLGYICEIWGNFGHKNMAIKKQKKTLTVIKNCGKAGVHGGLKKLGGVPEAGG